MKQEYNIEPEQWNRGEGIMVFGNFEQGGIIAMLGGVLALVVSYVLVRRFNKEIREQKQRHKSV